MTETLPYYNYNALLSRNATFNFVVGGRGLGKTYGAKYWAINDFLKHENQFIYLRRYKTEQGGRGTFFSDIADRFPEMDFRVNGMTAETRPKNSGKKTPWKTMGFFTQLSNALTQKSIAYPRVTKIIFDEFIIDKGAVRYLPNEVKAFQEFYSTVDRWKDKTRAIFLANAISMMNPYFLEYDINPDGSEWISKNDGFILAHFPDGQSFAGAVYRTKFGRFIENTEYAEYAVGSHFTDDSGLLIGPKPEEAHYLMTLETKDGICSIWNYMDYDGYRWWASDKRPRGGENMRTMMLEHVSEDQPYLPYGDKLGTMMRTAFYQARFMFTSAKARHAFEGIFKR